MMNTRPQTLGYALADSPVGHGRLLLRQVRRVDVQRRRARAGAHARRNARRHHALLAHEHRHVLVAVLLGCGAARRRAVQRLRHQDGPRGGHDLPRRDLPRPAQLGRAGVPQTHLLERGRQGRPLCRVGGAGALRRRSARGVSFAAHRCDRKKRGPK